MNNQMREAGDGAPVGATASESGDSNIVNAPTEPATESSASSTSGPEATSPQGDLIDPLAGLSVEELRALLLEAAPYLRQLAHQCEACGGGGEIQIDDDRAAECKHCKPIWDLVQQIEPRGAPPAPVAVGTLEYCDKTANCILAKGHEGDCDDSIPF